MKRSLRLTGAALVIVVTIIVLVFGSPLLLVLVQRFYAAFDWQLLSAVGQSYTGIATVLSLLAFLGVVYSVTLQTRQNVSQQAARAMQIDLFLVAIHERGLAKLFSPSGSMSAEVHQKFSEHVYMTLVLRYFQYSFTVGNMSSDALRAALEDDIFESARFRAHWEAVVPAWRREASSSTERRFVEIVDVCREVAAAKSA